MLGAIVGDIVGSRFEFDNYRDRDFELFARGCFATDDSVMTLAVAKALIETERSVDTSINDYRLDDNYHRLLGELTIRYMREIGRKYPDCGYGGMLHAGCSETTQNRTTASAMERPCVSARPDLSPERKPKR